MPHPAFLGENMNYAQEFKLAFENSNVDEMTLIWRKWADDSPDDANLTLAALILMLMLGDVSSRKIRKILVAADYQRPLDESLHGWYEDAAIGIMEKRIVENIMENPALAGKFAYSKKVGIEHDNRYARHFLCLYNKKCEDRDYVGSHKVEDLTDDLIRDWCFHFPDDANLTCAYVIVNIDYLDIEEIEKLIWKANSQEAIDMASHSQILSIMIEKATQKARGCKNQSKRKGCKENHESERTYQYRKKKRRQVRKKGLR